MTDDEILHMLTVAPERAREFRDTLPRLIVLRLVAALREVAWERAMLRAKVEALDAEVLLTFAHMCQREEPEPREEIEQAWTRARVASAYAAEVYAESKRVTDALAALREGQ